jgi:pectinesterase
LCQTANPQQYKYDFTVAKDGTGDYKLIQDAIDAHYPAYKEQSV